MRRYEAKTIGRTEVLWISRETYFEFFGSEDRKGLKKSIPPVSLSKILEAVLINETLKRKSSEAWLDATNFNYMVQVDRIDIKNKDMVKKLYPWMIKAKKRETSNPDVNEQLKKIQILSVRNERFIVDNVREFKKIEKKYPSIKLVKSDD